MTQANVVDISVSQPSRVVLPPALHAVRHTARRQLASLVQSLFDNTDDALFELADKAQSDQQQDMYFDSMRQLRLHRKEISQLFHDKLNVSFTELVKPNEPATGESDDEADWSLVENEELEMTVAVSGIVSKITSLHSLPIMQLTKRLNSVVESNEVNERNNPLGPQALSTAFADSLAGLVVNIRVRIIIMKLFERFVMERMGGVYEAVNQQLVSAGVLPDLKSTNLTKRSNRARLNKPNPETPNADPQGGAQAAGVPGASAGGGFEFASVQSLLAGARESGGFGGMGSGGSSLGMGHGAGSNAGGFGGQGQAGGPNIPIIALPQDELIQELAQLQTSSGEAELEIDKVPSVVDVRSLVLASRGESHSLKQADDDAVNFVGLLFDYILNDRNLAIPMKALIGRLQIPFVKLAIIDKTFFAKSLHPARALLNELSTAGIGWSSAKELKRDEAYNRVEAVIHRVLSEFSDDASIFQTILEDFRAYAHKASRRTVLVEQRVKDTEQGKARTREAKRAVQSVINQKACGLRLPTEVGKFTSEIWSRVLTLRFVKYGQKSQEWSEGIEVLDTLLWALQPLSEAVEVDQRDACENELARSISEGMQEIGTPLDEIQEFTHWLSDHLALLSKNDRAFLEVDVREEIDAPTEVVEEIILEATFVEPEQDLPEKQENEVKSITEGTWVEFTDGEDPLRCKLATITKPDQKYVFVNRRGMKVAEKNRLQLAGLFELNQINLIDESQVFDRALQSVIGNLRELQRNNR